LLCVCCAADFSRCTFPFSATRYTILPTRHFFICLCFFYLVLFWQIYYYMDYELNFMHALDLHLLLQPRVLCSRLVLFVAVDVYLLRAHRDSYAVVLMVANGVDDGRCRR